jgi:hypothetical protein
VVARVLSQRTGVSRCAISAPRRESGPDGRRGRNTLAAPSRIS